MDKKNIILGLCFLLAGFGLMFWQGQQLYPAQESAGAQVASSANQYELDSGASTVVGMRVADRPEAIIQAASAGSSSIVQSVKNVAAEKNDTADEPAQALIPEEIHTLENAYIRVRFSTKGGAIKDIALKKYPLELNSELPYVFNSGTLQPALGISLSDEGRPKAFVPEYQLVDFTDQVIRFRHVTEEGLKIIRGYKIHADSDAEDPYVIIHETRFINDTKSVFDLKRIFVHLGAFPETQGDTLGEYLNFGYFNGKKSEFIKVTEFRDSKGFFGLGAHQAKEMVFEQRSPIVWASVKNQFFASVLTPQEPGVGFYVKPTEVGCGSYVAEGISGSMLMDLGTLNPGDNKLLDMSFYVGPKEYRRLDMLGQDQDQIMQFGFFGFISKLLLTMMVAVHSFVPNWGMTIIVVTLIIKLILWPLTAAQVRSSKRMAAIQEPLKAIKEKYKGNAQKIQTETMKLFKEYKVNPAAGCLPLLVQLPIFLGLYFMLRTSSELRFAPFLWIHDLSLPDTVAVIAGFPLNILPLIMGASMFIQMKMTPTPTTDNAQKKMLQFMPFIFLFFCYNFPSGLVLYWTMQNILTIAQQYFTRNMADPVLESSQEKPKKKGGKKHPLARRKK